MKFLIIIFTCLFAFTAQAKLTLEGKPFSPSQIDTVKGFLYITYAEQAKEDRKETLQVFARSIDWLNSVHASKRVYEVSKLKETLSNAPALTAIAFIIVMLQDPDQPEYLKDHFLQYWTDRGSRVYTVFRKGKTKKVYSAIFLRKEKNKNESNKK